MKLYSAALLFASLAGYSTADVPDSNSCSDAFDCADSGCIVCTGATTDGADPGKILVTIDLTGCKTGGISWACCAFPDTCAFSECDGNRDGTKVKCDDVKTLTVEVDEDVEVVVINTHDGAAYNDDGAAIVDENGNPLGGQQLWGGLRGVCGEPGPFGSMFYQGGGCVNSVNSDTGNNPPDVASAHCLKNVLLNTCPSSPVASPPVASPVSAPVQTGGDPHFKTFSGQWFDYHGECDLVFLSAPDFANGLGMDIHVRTTIRYEYSHIEAAALRIGGEIFELGGWGDYILSGIVGANLPNTISGYKITYEHPSDKVHAFTLHISDTERIVMKSIKEMVSITLDGPSEANYRSSVGMLGNYGEGKLLMRDGKTQITNNFNKLGQEWQVLSSEPKLFEAVREPQHPQQCKLPEAGAMQKRRRLGESVMEATARKACQHWGDAIEQCVYDVMATGDLEFADAGAY